MVDDKCNKTREDAAKALIRESPLLRSMLDEMFYLEAVKSREISPVSAAIRVRQIRNARVVPAEDKTE